jgi:hypothetical protein
MAYAISNAPLAVNTLAEHPGIIAAFVYKIGSTPNVTLVGHAHYLEAQAGEFAPVWRQPSDLFAEACFAAHLRAGEHGSLHVGDAQVLKYTHDGTRAIVIVTNPNTPIHKSCRRMMRRVLRHLASGKVVAS